jgi:hypothetical protein
MLTVRRLVKIESPSTTMPPVRLGKVPSGIGTADLFVTICDGELPLLRVDLYPDSSSESAVFQDAIVWRDNVFVGLGHTVYVIDPKTRLGFAVRLENYFAAFNSGEDYLLVVSADALLRMTADGKVLWKTPGLGLDGVTINRVGNGCVEGQGEWEPPEGWRPFKLQLESGRLVTD